MATVILVRHGRTTANATGVLAGRLAGVKLDETGQGQAARAADRLAPVPLAAVVSSPLERCRQTAKTIMGAQTGPLTVATEELAKEKLWATVQSQPSAAAFPGGESLGAMQARAVAAVRRHDAAVEATHGVGAVWVAVSHGDIIKSVLADALGMHLDLFQRLNVDPASMSIIRYTSARPYVLATNTHEGDLAWLAPKPGRRARRSTEAAVGGGAGPGPLPPRP